MSQPRTWEVIVVDDGSRDATSEVAAGSGVRVIRLHPNQGKGGAVRAGVLAATGSVIAYVDADLNIAPSNLLEALHRLEETSSNLLEALDRLEPAPSNPTHGLHRLKPISSNPPEALHGLEQT